MEIRKNTRVFINLDEIVDRTNSSEQRLLLRPLINKLLDYYQPVYNGAVENEKKAKEGTLTGTPEGNKDLAIWQGKRKKALYRILEILTEIQVNLLELNTPLKEYHNDCMGCHTEVKT